MSDKAAYIKDRLIIAAPVLGPYVVALIIVFVVRPYFIGQMIVLSISSVFAAGLSLLPVVCDARMRMLKRKYPDEEEPRNP